MGLLGGFSFRMRANPYPEARTQRDEATAHHCHRLRFNSGAPANDKTRSMVFFYHDPHNERLRMHTIRDYLP